MNNRETFLKVKQHLLCQRQKAVTVSGSCAYRAPNGLVCAVGCLIKDEHYTEEIEFCAMPTHSYLTPKQAMLIKALRSSGCDASIDLLWELQYIHDSIFPGKWKDELDRLEKTLD